MIKKYKSAYVLGKFMPFHTGHKFLIDTAIQYSEKVTILVGSIDSEPIPGRIRYQWVRDTYKDIDNVTVKWCNEDLPQYPEEHEDFWNIWVGIVKRYCPPIDVIFTSEKYGDPYAEHLGVKHHLVDLERKTYPVSGTLSRTETFKYWEYLPDIVKPYFIKRIAIMGPESTGKSNLTINLSKYYNTQYVEEYGRTVYEENGNHVSVEDFVKISLGRQKIEDEKLKISNKLLFCDTEDITTYYLCKEYYSETWEVNKDFFEDRIKNSKKYDLYILLQPDCEGVQDGTRCFLDHRERHYQIIKNILINGNYNFIDIGGSWENRFTQSIKKIDENFCSK